MRNTLVVATSVPALVAAALLAQAAEGTAAPPALAAQVAGTLPRVEPPELPADGAGVYRLSLSGALGNAPLVVLLEVKASQVGKAVALPIHSTRVPWPADPSKLVVEDGRIVGTLAVEATTECGTHPERLVPGNTSRPKAVDYRLEPLASGKVTLDVPCKQRRGIGKYAAAWSGGALPFHAKANTVENGVVHVLREAPRRVPERCDLELQMYAGLADVARVPAVVVRARMMQGVLADMRGYVRQDGGPEKPMKVNRSGMTLRDGRLTGRIEGEEGRPFTLEISGEVLGRQLHGTVTCVDGASRVSTAWLGQLHDVDAWRLPLDYSRSDWTWEHDLPADPALVKQASDEARRPVLPGEPG